MDNPILRDDGWFSVRFPIQDQGVLGPDGTSGLLGVSGLSALVTLIEESEIS